MSLEVPTKRSSMSTTGLSSQQPSLIVGKAPQRLLLPGLIPLSELVPGLGLSMLVSTSVLLEGEGSCSDETS